jgi:hypothetical protein
MPKRVPRSLIARFLAALIFTAVTAILIAPGIPFRAGFGVRSYGAALASENQPLGRNAA